MCFPRAGHAEDEDVLRAVDECACAELRDLTPDTQGQSPLIEDLQGLSRREMSGRHQTRDPTLAPPGYLHLQQVLQERLQSPVFMQGGDHGILDHVGHGGKSEGSAIGTDGVKWHESPP